MSYSPSLVQAENLIKKAINGPAGNSDWSSILRLISLLDSQNQLVVPAISTICRHLSHGHTGRKLNCLILIDALFKNGKASTVQILQNKTLMEALDSNNVSANPELHNFLYTNMPDWITALQEKNVLLSNFESWTALYCSTHYVPKLTKLIRKKLFKDLQGCIEILIMLSECLVNYQDTDRKLLKEMIANSEEITRRLYELQPTIVDKQLSNAIYSTRELCDNCIHSYLAFEKGEDGNAQALLQMANRSASIVKAMSKPPPKAPKQTRIPPKLQNTETNDLTDTEFFIRLAQLKTKKVQQPSQPMNETQIPLQEPSNVVETDSLIEF